MESLLLFVLFAIAVLVLVSYATDKLVPAWRNPILGVTALIILVAFLERTHVLHF